MNTVGVRRLAKNLHANHTMKNGKKYFGHLHRVAQRSLDIYYKEADYITDPDTIDEVLQTAYLHDSIEDRTTAEMPLASGVHQRVVNNVLILSKTKGEDYFTYLERIKANPVARIVKMADLEHNSKLSRLNLNEPIEKTIERHTKYLKAYVYLKS